MNEDLNTNLSYILNEHKVEEQEEEKKEKEKSNGKYFLFSIILIALIYASIMYSKEIKETYDDISKNLFSNNSTSKESIYREKLDSSANVERTESKAKIEKIEVEKIKEVIVTKEPTKEDLVTMFNTDNFKVLKCTNYKIHKFEITNTCKKDLDIFLKENNKAFRFEVTAILGQQDVKAYLKYKAYLEDVLMAGISYKRISAVILEMKEKLSENSIITANGTYIKTDDPLSSVMIKAYH